MKYLIQNKHWKINKKYNIDKLLYLLVDRSDDIIIYPFDRFVWRNKNQDWHRNYDLPAAVQEQLAMKPCNLWWYIKGIYKKSII